MPAETEVRERKRKRRSWTPVPNPNEEQEGEEDFDETTYCWYSTYGNRFIGPPSHFAADVDLSPDLDV